MYGCGEQEAGVASGSGCGCKEVYIIIDFLILALYVYSDVIHLFDWKSAVEHDGSV